MKKELFKTPFFSLVQDEHYFNIEYSKPQAGTVIVPVVDEEYIVFVSNYRYPLKEHMWELPRGFIDAGEEAIEAAKRELKEETSFHVELSNLHSLGLIAPDSSLINNKLPVFKAVLKASDETKEELDKEISQYKLVKISELSQWIQENKVSDGITLSALFLYMASK